MRVKIDRTGSRQVTVTFTGAFTAAAAVVDQADHLTEHRSHYITVVNQDNNEHIASMTLTQFWAHQSQIISV